MGSQSYSLSLTFFYSLIGPHSSNLFITLIHSHMGSHSYTLSLTFIHSHGITFLTLPITSISSHIGSHSYMLSFHTHPLTHGVSFKPFPSLAATSTRYHIFPHIQPHIRKVSFVHPFLYIQYIHAKACFLNTIMDLNNGFNISVIRRASWKLLERRDAASRD
jgi:hypothetical protein